MVSKWTVQQDAGHPPVDRHPADHFLEDHLPEDQPPVDYLTGDHLHEDSHLETKNLAAVKIDSDPTRPIKFIRSTQIAMENNVSFLM